MDFFYKILTIEKVPLSFHFKTFIVLIRDKTYLFFQSRNGLSTIFMIESFRNFLNSTYNRDSTYIFSWSEILLSTVLIIESFRNFANSTYNREGAYNRVTRVLTILFNGDTKMLCLIVIQCLQNSALCANIKWKVNSYFWPQ